MFTRIRIIIALALTALLVTPTGAFAKGGFDFITIAGPDLKESVRVADPRLTADFFTFANFYEDKTKAPADPGVGYEITRHYVQGISDVVFDRLYYYPETGFVFYDGIENGESEYDGEWYTANAEIQSVFESVLSIQSADKFQSSSSAVSGTQTQPGMLLPPLYLVLLAILGVTLISLFTYRLRKIAFLNSK
ncbi:MAG TPA: hypothetical protein VFH34_06060 [Anaerolineales bacterium]|nr:hypothetical protein [Anaerolineales bacterium]